MTTPGTIRIPTNKPRNPMVVPAAKRKAGKHKNKKRREERDFLDFYEDKNTHKE